MQLPMISYGNTHVISFVNLYVLSYVNPEIMKTTMGYLINCTDQMYE